MAEPFDAAAVQSLLQAGDARAAVEHIHKWLEHEPHNVDSLYHLAVAHRYSDNPDEALNTVQQLHEMAPKFGRGHQEAGYIHLVLRQPEQALQAFNRAVVLNDSLLASWRNIIKLCVRPEHAELRKQALLQSERLAALPPALLSVRNAIAESNLRKAEDICRHFLRQNPTHVEAMRLLADLGVRSEVLDDAEFLLESALDFEPENRFARFDYMNVLYRRQKYEQALSEAKQLLKLEPDNAQYQTGYANQCVAVGRFDEALAIYDEVLGRFPETAPLHLLRGHALKTVGRTDEAIDAYRQTYSTNPNCGDAYWSLANLKTFRFAEDEVETMQRKEVEADLEIDDRVHFCFALGKHFEDRKDYATSFDYYNPRQRITTPATRLFRRITVFSISPSTTGYDTRAVRQVRRQRLSGRGPNFYCRSTASRLNLIGANPKEPLASRWHSGAAEYRCIGLQAGWSTGNF